MKKKQFHGKNHFMELLQNTTSETILQQNIKKWVTSFASIMILKLIYCAPRPVIYWYSTNCCNNIFRFHIHENW